VWSVDNLTETDVKCNDEAQHSLLARNQYDADPLFETSCSSTETRLIFDLSYLVRDLNL
jgi:hypothetical protein